MTTNNVLYWSGTMLDADMSVDAQISQVKASGFTAVLLWSLHVNGNGDLYWNNTPLVVSQGGVPVFDPQKVFQNLSQRLDNLLNLSTVNHVFFSIGSGGVQDFQNITNLLATAQGTKTLENNFQTLKNELSQVTGFDFDDEDDFNVDTVAWLTEFLATQLDAVITYCPYMNQAFWEECLEVVYENMGTQPVLWWNLQCYSGGAFNDPADWLENIEDNTARNGVTNPQSFIIPGYAAQNNQGDGPGQCPSAIEQTFASLKGVVEGGFIWNSEHIFVDGTGLCNGGTATVAQYAQAITNGLAQNVKAGSLRL